jgi:undecaprenyl-diphosphatase
MMFYLKALFKRKRPLNAFASAKGLSFPSGHAIMSITFYGLLIYIISNSVENKGIKLPAVLALVFLIQGIGFSRVYFRVHYASDVAIGYVAGFLWLLVSLGVIKNIEEYDSSITENLNIEKAITF